jgi:hypothetical protein
MLLIKILSEMEERRELRQQSIRVRKFQDTLP